MPSAIQSPERRLPQEFHYGNGGSVGYADPDTGVGFGYVMNHVLRRKQNRRNRKLTDALDSCV